MRAVADNPDLAASSGIDVEGIIRFVTGRWAPRWRASVGALFALNERVGVQHRLQNLLLLMFAGITLGGLGTAYVRPGGILHRRVRGGDVSTLVVPVEMKNVGRAGGADRRAVDGTAGHHKDGKRASGVRPWTGT